jgi:hypothetical protein
MNTTRSNEVARREMNAMKSRLLILFFILGIYEALGPSWANSARKGHLMLAQTVQKTVPGQITSKNVHLSRVITCPTTAAFKLYQVPSDWTGPGTVVNFFGAETTDTYHAGKESLVCKYNMDGLGKFTWFIYQDVPKGNCKLGADKKSFECNP